MENMEKHRKTNVRTIISNSAAHFFFQGFKKKNMDLVGDFRLCPSLGHPKTMLFNENCSVTSLSAKLEQCIVPGGKV